MLILPIKKKWLGEKKERESQNENGNLQESQGNNMGNRKI